MAYRLRSIATKEQPEEAIYDEIRDNAGEYEAHGLELPSVYEPIPH